MELIIKILQFFLCFTILVGIHELGHFIMARVFRIRVEKFYIFFDPWFSLFKFRRGNTEYGLGWLPLGGYVKIAGMIDESMDKEYQQREVQPWEFRAKPAWQRFLVMIAGVVMNVLLAITIYIGICYTWGETYFLERRGPLGLQLQRGGPPDGIPRRRPLRLDRRREGRRHLHAAQPAAHHGERPRGGRAARREAGDAAT